MSLKQTQHLNYKKHDTLNIGTLSPYILKLDIKFKTFRLIVDAEQEKINNRLDTMRNNRYSNKSASW